MLRIICAILYFAALTGHAGGGPKPKPHPKPPCHGFAESCKRDRASSDVRVEFEPPANLCTKLNPHGAKDVVVWFERNRCDGVAVKGGIYRQQECAYEERI